jgi:hypothetical protein
VAYREVGWETSDDDDAYSNACRLERRPRIKDRIEYLSEDLIAHAGEAGSGERRPALRGEHLHSVVLPPFGRRRNPGAAGRLEIVGGAKLQGPHGAK